MADRRIAIGETSSFRYIGVEPPLEDAAAEGIIRRLRLPAWILSGMTYHEDTTPGGPPYTEFGLDVGDGLEHLGKDEVDNVAVELARMIGRMLEEQGDDVEVLEGIVATDFEHPLFGEDADRYRELATLADDLIPPADE